MEKKIIKRTNQGEEELVSKTIYLEEFAKECSLELKVGNAKDLMTLSSYSVNRPGLFFANFEDYFASSRVQVLGNAEIFYLAKLESKQRIKVFERLCAKEIPCIIIARGHTLDETCYKIAKEKKVPVFITNAVTSDVVNDVTTFLNKLLAFVEVLNGELLEINGLGVLLTGSSGMGKSETALDLITRGHRLVSDDIVIVKKIKGELIGTAPEEIRFYMEVRGIGIIDVRSLYGVGAVLHDKKIDLIIELKRWSNDVKVERLGNVSDYEEILGIKVPKISLPVAAGRNLAIIVEVAARHFRLKNLGYDSIEEFLKNKKFY